MNFNRVATVSALTAVAAIGLAGCQSTQKALGMSKVVPDEFRVVSKAPLAVPPDYALRPPTPGAPRPQDGTTRDQAAQILKASPARSSQMFAGRSQGEQMLLGKEI